MQYFYDGQIRRYLLQTIRVFSNFVVKYGDGTLVQVPVTYGDPDRQAASIIRQNSENKVNSVPRIAVYITDLSLDKDRLSDSSYVGKLHFRERDTQIDPNTGRETYNQAQGRNYTVERLMPTPFKLKMKVDIWASSTEQKLQLLEQMLVLFNPSLELQTTDNYIDWTSLTVLNLNEIRWSSRTVPVGNDSPIDIATLTVDTPIWISPPAKVKHLGVITRVITSFFQSVESNQTGYIDGLGVDLTTPTVDLSGQLTQLFTTPSEYGVVVFKNEARLLGHTEDVIPRKITLEIGQKQGPAISWKELLSQYPNTFVPGSTRIQLAQKNGSYVIGTIVLDPLDETLMRVNWDPDTYPSNTDITTDSRPNSPGTFDAIINPLTYNPRRPHDEDTDQDIILGLRFLIIEDIGSEINDEPSQAWGELVAHANDIIEWNGNNWIVVFDSVQNSDTIVVQTNIYTGVQYLWNGIQWTKSFEGEYRPGEWRLEF